MWSNSSYQLGLRITDAFAKYGWTSAIRGVEGGGKVEGMTAHTYKTNEGDIVLKCPTEVTITDRREKELNDLGFIAVNSKGSNFAAFLVGKQLTSPSFIIWITQMQTLSYLQVAIYVGSSALHITLRSS